MKRTLLFVIVSLLSVNSFSQTRRAPRALAPPIATGRVNTQTLPIRRVILYSNGVAYIERRGTISGHAEISLSFKQSQVDDVLKSMVVLDLGQGRIGAVSYNSSAPPSTRMAEIPFAISSATDGNNGGLAGVLSQLQGARVIVATGTRAVTGSILTVEAKKVQIDADGPAVIEQRLVIASDNGELSSFDLAEVRSVQLADEGARRDLTEFAHAAAAARRRDAKTIVVTSDGPGPREMIVSYTIAAPIWKTTYRVVLDRTGKPFFQGWAIVDNVSEEDWDGVQLSLVSGTPVSFIQPIQNPVYRYRPIIPYSEDLNLKPQTYEPGEGGSGMTGSLSGTVKDLQGAVVPGASVVLTNARTNQSFELTTDDEGRYRAENLPAGLYALSAYASGFQKSVVTNLNVTAGVRSNYDVNLQVGSVTANVTVQGTANVDSAANNFSLNSRNVQSLLTIKPGLRNTRPSLSNLIASRDSGVEAETTGNEIGDLFEYHIDQAVTVPRDRSALIPILQTQMEGERVSIFNEQSRQHRPLSGLLLKNTSPLTLEDGSLTVIDGDAYAGEALMERLKPQEERLVSFALDLGTLVNVHDEEENSRVFLLRAINGVVQAHYYEMRKKVYTLVNQTEHPRIVYLEHPIDEDDWELADTMAKPTIRTAKFYRFRVELAPHQKLDFPIVERQEKMESYALVDFTRPQLELFIARKYIDAQTRAELEKILDVKSRIGATDVRIHALDKEASEIAQDQQRLRDNIKALTATAEAKQLISRYVAKADTQETRLEQLNKDKQALIDERARLQGELEALVRGLAIDRQLTN
jgi:hypothetical protein